MLNANEFGEVRETVGFWIDEFNKENPNPTIEIINNEIEETKGTISNEELWLLGDPEGFHDENLIDLNEYLEWLEEKKTEMEGK